MIRPSDAEYSLLLTGGDLQTCALTKNENAGQPASENPSDLLTPTNLRQNQR